MRKGPVLYASSGIVTVTIAQPLRSSSTARDLIAKSADDISALAKVEVSEAAILQRLERLGAELASRQSAAALVTRSFGPLSRQIAQWYRSLDPQSANKLTRQGIALMLLNPHAAQRG